MPPRFTYWTIIFGGQPTSFRSGTRDELLPTFKQIQSKHPDAQLRYFARGKLWYSEEEARADLIRARRPDRPPFRSRPEGDRPPRKDGPPRDSRWPKPDWKNRPPRDSRGPRPAWNKDRSQGDARPQWKDRPPRESRGPRPDWKNRPQGGGKPRPPGPPKPRSGDGGADRWRDRPQGSSSGRPPGGGDRRGRDWRPGGQHKDPRDRFKVPRDVKRARMAKKFGWKKKDDSKKKDEE